MAPTLKAAFIAAILAVLVLPSVGRCPSLGPEAAPTPAPTPAIPCSDCDEWAAPTLAPTPAIQCSDCDEWAAPTPAPTPAILCSDCDKRCFDACYAKVKVMCQCYGCSGCWNGYMPKCVKPCESDCRVAGCVSG